MRARALATLLLAASLALPATAEIRPVPRPQTQVDILSTEGSTAAPKVAAVPESVRPVQRATPAQQLVDRTSAALRAPEPRVDAGGAVRLSERPVFRPADLLLAMGDSLRRATGGGLCGRRAIRGARIGTLRDEGECGIRDAVRVTRVGGIELIEPARMDCDTARALDNWVRDGVLPTVGRTGGGAVALRTASGYACRGRNNQDGAKLSEHARGKAIDIAAIELADGSRISVLEDWDDDANGGAKGRMLRALHRAACGPFGTVLGPDADAYHRDHLHFDTADYRSGSYCQ